MSLVDSLGVPRRITTPVAATPEAKIPHLSWDVVAKELDGMWAFDNAPHHSIIGLTGSGKSYLATRGILPLVEHDKVLIIDNKGDDPTLRGIGKPVKQLPHPTVVKWKMRQRDRKPRDLWYRLVVTDDWTAARIQVKDAIERVWNDQRWVVVLDETRSLTDPREPGLRLRAYCELIWTKGRSRQVPLIAMTQAPSWVPASFYDQPSFVWIGRINDEDKQKRLREIGGLSRAHLPVIQNLKKRQFLLVAEGGDFMAITGLKT